MTKKQYNENWNKNNKRIIFTCSNKEYDKIKALAKNYKSINQYIAMCVEKEIEHE